MTGRLFGLFFFLYLALTAGEARAQATRRVVVVEVSGDGLDAAAVREAIGRELDADAIAPDDPRAGAAAGRLAVEARTADKKLVVRYRKLGEPVERSVALPEDATRVRSEATVLAGNVARDEAGEILGALQRPKVEAPKPTPPAAFAPPERDPLIDTRAVLRYYGDRAKTRRIATSVAYFAVAAGAGTAAVVLASDAKGGEDSTHARAGDLLSGVALVGAIDGTLSLILAGDPHEVLQLQLDRRPPGESPAETLEWLDREWKNGAERAATGRRVGGVLTSIAAATSLTFAILGPALTPRDDKNGASIAVTYVGGISALVFGAIAADALFSETTIETSYRTWKTMRDGAAGLNEAKLHSTFGVAPAPGGAMASFSLTF
jgi:hypothetical protein